MAWLFPRQATAVPPSEIRGGIGSALVGVARARARKPAIPLIGSTGTPLRDEVMLVRAPFVTNRTNSRTIG
jgi:hypothetical protein